MNEFDVSEIHKPNMYEGAKTWNPFMGCFFDCVYCERSFKAQAKRRKQDCLECYNYKPHIHPERLSRIPSPAPNSYGERIVFVVGTGDISFCDLKYTRKIIKAIKEHRPRFEKTYYFQSKNPAYFEEFLKSGHMGIGEFPDNSILLTTLETNRDKLCSKVSKAPLPSKRWKDFKKLEFNDKVLTIEPVIDFDLEKFVDIVLSINEYPMPLKYVWFGFDSKNCGLPEPSIEKAQKFVDTLIDNGINVRGKTLREVKINE